MVNPNDRGRYVASTDGAPPLPPPGGYRAAKRVPDSAVDLPEGAPLPPEAFTDRHRKPMQVSWVGIIAVAAASVLAIVLLGSLAMQDAARVYGINMLAAQLGVLVLVIAALFSKRGRVLGASALAVALVFNVGTVGALIAVRTSAVGSYTQATSESDRFWQSYPGIKGVDPASVLAQPSLEEVRAKANTVLADMRAALTSRYGTTWFSTPELVKPERNGYGGESMLQSLTSEAWFSNEPVQQVSTKYAVMDVLDQVAADHGLSELRSINDPSYGLSADTLTKMFGSDDPDTQVQWEWYAYDWDSGAIYYIDLIDLSRDSSGEFTKARDAMHAQTGEPREGIQLLVYASQLLSDADEDAFRDAISKYP